jgi:autotransporter-associated beta strand protein
LVNFRSIHTSTHNIMKSKRNQLISTRTRSLLSGVALVLALAAGTGRAQTYTWSGPNNGDWGNNANWAPSGYPNAAGDIAWVTNAIGIAFSNGVEQVIVGGVVYSNSTSASGNLVIGTPAQPGVQLTAQVSSGKPVLYVGTNSSHQVFFYVQQLLGTQGLSKTGPGKFTFRYNPNPLGYSGDIEILAGILGINQNSSLGDDNNNISIAGGARLTAEPGSSTGVITLPSTRTITLNGAQSQLSATPAAVELALEGAVGGTGGLTKVDAGKLSLNGTATYAGPTRVVGGSVDFNLSSGSFLQQDEIFVNANNAVLDFSDLNFLTMTNAAPKQLRVIPSGSSSTSGEVADLYLANGASAFAGGTNVITASSVLVGSASQSAGNNHEARLHLGQANTFNVGSFQVGGFNARGTVSFQSAPATPHFKLRDSNGVSRVSGLVKIGETSSGTRSGGGNLNLAGGTVDVLAGEIIVSRHTSNASNSDNSQATIDNGIFDATTLVLCDKINGGATNTPNPVVWPTLTGTFTQNGGTVMLGTILMGREASGIQYPVVRPAYNLVNGTLYAGLITNGFGGYNSDPQTERRLNWSSGTIRNYPGADLFISGSGSGDRARININVGGGADPTFHADAGRTITIGAGARLNEADDGWGGTLTSDIISAGPGALRINSVNPWGGTLHVNAGTLGGSGALNGPVIVGSAATLAPGASAGTLTVNNSLTLAGKTVMEIDFQSGVSTNFDRVVGVTTLTYGGTLVITNIGGPIPVGQTFQLFDAQNYAGTFTSVTAPAGYTIQNNLAANGSITILSAPAVSPVFTYEREGNELIFNWTPAGGFKLQAQTNALNVGIQTNAAAWHDYPGGGTPPVVVPVNPTNPSVFYRLKNTP